MTPFFAAVSIGTFAAAESGFIGKEVVAVDASFNLVCQRDKTLKVVVRPQRIIIIDGRCFGFGYDIKSEQRLFSVCLLERIAKRGCLQVFISFTDRSF